MAPSSLFVSSIILALGGGGFIPSVSAIKCSDTGTIGIITGGFSCVGEGYCIDVGGNYYSYIRHDSPGVVSAASCITKCGGHGGLAGVGVRPANNICECYYSKDNNPSNSHNAGEGAVAKASGHTNYYCLKNDRYGITATPTASPTTALDVYKLYKVVGSPATTCTVDGENISTCNFWTVLKEDPTSHEKVPIETTSLNAAVIFEPCREANFDFSPVEVNVLSQVSATKEVPEVTSDEKNCGDAATTENNGKVCSVSRPFCARASLFDTSTTPPMEVMAEILEGSVTYKYSTSGDFDTTVTTKAYEAKSATTEDQVTEDGLSAYQCDGDGVTSTNAMAMGSILNICVHTSIAGASVDITSLELKQGDGTVLSTLIQNSQTTLVTSSKAIDSVDDGGTIKTMVLVISSLMSPTIFDGATFSENDSGLDTAILTATGAAKIIYGGNVRKLMNIRLLQAPGGESFDVEVDLVRNELPAIAMSKNNAEKTIGVLGAMVSMAFGAYMIM